MARHIKSGDTVQILSGADKGKTGKVLKVLTKADRVVVEGINRVWKHVKPNQRNPQGGRIQMEVGIALSKVLPVDPGTGKGTRVKFESASGGKRRLTKGGAELSVLAKAK